MKHFIYCTLALTLLLITACKGGKSQHGDGNNADSLTITDTTYLVQQDSIVGARIRDFYDEYVFGAEELTTHVVESYCTPELKQFLADAYDVEGDGYAVWEFRADQQDGPSRESAVTSIIRTSDFSYVVSYSDMGTPGATLITVVEEEGDYKFSSIKRIK